MITPEELIQQLVALFPSFVDEYKVADVDEDKEFDYGFESPLTLHRVWMDFAPVAQKHLTHASERVLVKFCALVNDEVAAGSDRENAVSTCFLEHASQVSVRKLIKPLLSSEARKELR
jgi:hypothetical protein